MSWDREPPTSPPPPPRPERPFALPGAVVPGADPTTEAPSPFRPAATTEQPAPPPPPPRPPAGPDSRSEPHGIPSGPPPGPPGSASPGWGGPPTAPPPLPAVDPPRRPPRRALRAVLGVVVVLGLFGLGFGARSLADEESRTVVQGPSSISMPDVTIDPGSEPVAAVAATVSPSVVQIETDNGLGSGVVYATGLVMTNAHVVGSAGTVTVRNADGSAVEGEVVGADTGTDIAVVRADGLDAPVASLASGLPSVGQIAVAVGSPFGLDQTVTSGIVSAVNRPVNGNDKGVTVNMIQTDASINPGNSGGALANRQGQIIGINTAIFSQTGDNAGIGFAIPVTTAKKAADTLASGRQVQKAVLGVQGPGETPDGDAGAYVEVVAPESGAAKAGILEGDLIVRVDDVEIRSFSELAGLISSRSPGDVVTITVDRGGETQQVQVTLGSG